MRVLMFCPPAERKSSGGGIRPYYFAKYLSELGHEVHDLWGWKANPLKEGQMKRYLVYFAHRFARGEKGCIVEGAPGRCFISMLNGLKWIMDYYDDHALQKEAYEVPISKQNREKVSREAAFARHRADLVIFPSPLLMKRFPDVEGKCVVVMNASDPIHFSCAPLQESAEMQIGLLTGLSPGRGIEMLIEACSIVRKDFPNLKLSVGFQRAGAVLEYEKELLSTYPYPWINLTSNVTYFHGAKEFYASCYLTVIPNRKHFYMDASTPIKLFDSMASARPVVVTDCIEQAKIVREEVCGLVCDFTPEDMAEKISKLLSAPELARKIGMAGRKAVVERHSWRRRAESVSAALTRISV